MLFYDSTSRRVHVRSFADAIEGAVPFNMQVTHTTFISFTLLPPNAAPPLAPSFSYASV